MQIILALSTTWHTVSNSTHSPKSTSCASIGRTWWLHKPPRSMAFLTVPGKRQLAPCTTPANVSPLLHEEMPGSSKQVHEAGRLAPTPKMFRDGQHVTVNSDAIMAVSVIIPLNSCLHPTGTALATRALCMQNSYGTSILPILCHCIFHRCRGMHNDV